MGFMNALDKVGDFFKDKTANTGEAAAHVALWAPGLALDLARTIPGTETLDDGVAGWLSAKKSLTSLTNLAMGESTITGSALSTVFEGLNRALQFGDDVLETVPYAIMAVPDDSAVGAELFSPDTWAQAWQATKNTNVAESTQMFWLDEAPSALGLKEPSIADPLAPGAWEKFTGDDASGKIHRGATDTTAFAFALAADPFVAANKIKLGLDAAKESKLLDAAAEGNFVEFAERSKDLSKRFDKLFGTSTAPKVDEFGETIEKAAMEKDGALDTWKTSAEIYKGLKLDRVRRGGEIADLLNATRHLEPGVRIDARRDIFAAMYGDLNAVARLNANVPNVGYAFTNAVKGEGNHTLAAAAADADKAEAIVAGKALATVDTPEFVAAQKAQLESQPDFYNWLAGQVDPNSHLTLPMKVTPAGNRAVSRLRGEGLSRDGKSLRTGYAALDSAGTSILLAGANMPGARYVSKGLAIAGVSAPLKVAAKTSDALRGRVAYGSLSVEDDNTTNVALVVQDMMRRAGAAPERVDHYLSMVNRAANPTQRSMAVQRAQNEAIRTIAKATGHDPETVAAIAIGSRTNRGRISSIDGQSYAASQVKDERAASGVRDVDVVFVPDSDTGETLIVPVLNTQTPNRVEVMDLDRAKKWLKSDHFVRALGAQAARVEPNPVRQAVYNSGLYGALPRMAHHDMVSKVHAAIERTNSLWKASALLTRPGSYAIRNTAEESLRVWALHRTAQIVEKVRSQNSSLNKRGMVKQDRIAADKLRNELQLEELDDRLAVFEDEGFVNEVNLIRKELKSLRAKRTKLKNRLSQPTDPAAAALHVAHGGALDEVEELRDVESAIRTYENHPTLLQHEVLGSEIADIRAGIEARVKKALSGTPEQGTRTVTIGSQQIELPEAYAEDEFWDIVAHGGGFDQEVAEVGARAMQTLRGLGQSPFLSVRNISPERPGSADIVRNHLETWAHILNFQIRQDAAGKVALQARAEGKDAEGIAQAVEDFLRSNRDYRVKNPMRSGDPEGWAGAIGQMVNDLVPSGELASILSRSDDSGKVTTQWLKENFDQQIRPDVHLSASDAIVGPQSRQIEAWTGRMFKALDRMSLQRMSRHPMFSMYFEESQERLVNLALKRAEREGLDSITVDEINKISHRARLDASHKLKQTFYDNHVRSSAAHQLRFVYPFFAAHQNSMTFWGRAFLNDPSKLRQMQLTFQAPASLGLVVDKDGNAVKPGEFIKSDHQVLLQMPPSWGGPNPKDPDSRGAGYRVSLGSFNLIMQNGSILNPGAGPLASVPAGYLQKQYGAYDEDVSAMMKWFNPFGAPKDSEVGAFKPTPVKRLGTLWSAYRGENDREYLDMYAMRLTDAQVEFAKENDRPPNASEMRKIEREVGTKVKYMAWMRFASSLASPTQPRPVSAMQGLIDEYRRMETEARENGEGPFAASDRFLDTYGDEFMALTKSSSMNRAHLNPSTGTAQAIRAHEALLDQLPEDVWQTVIGPEGEGAFSIDAYRWMQDKSLRPGEKLIDKRGQSERMFDVAESAGWREYKKFDGMLRDEAVARGTSVEKDPQLKAARKAMLDDLKARFPQWASAYEGGSRSEAAFEDTYIKGLRKIASNGQLLRDTNRSDIQLVGKYLMYRDLVKAELKARADAGQPAGIDAKANADVAYAFAAIVTSLRDDNDHFADYTFAPIIQKDPLYVEDALEGTQ